MSFFHAARASLAAERALYPHVCAVCSLRRREPGICAHHHESFGVGVGPESGEGYAEGWAAGNRIWCAFFHRREIAALAVVLAVTFGCSKAPALPHVEIETWQGLRLACAQITYMSRTATGSFINRSGQYEELPEPPKLLCYHGAGGLTPVLADDVKEIRWGR